MMSAKELGRSTVAVVKVSIVRAVWLTAVLYVMMCVVLELLQHFGANHHASKHDKQLTQKFRLDKLRISGAEKPLLEELHRRSLYVREVCEAWGLKSQRAAFLKNAPKYKSVVTAAKNITKDREFLSRQQLDHIWHMTKGSQFQKLVIDRKHSLTWCKVPKAASTSWVKIFLLAAGKKPVEEGPGATVHKYLRRTFPHLPDTVVKQILPTHLKFMVARHPFDRILSAYRDKLEDYDRDLKYGGGHFQIMYGRNIVKTYRDNSENTSSTSREPTFREFVRYLIDTDTEAYDSHWQPISNLCTPCRIKYDVIIRMESLAQDSAFVLRNRNLDHIGRLEWAHKTDPESDKTELTTKYYSQLLPSEIRQLYYIYLMDFLLFEYDPTPYFNIVDAATDIETIEYSEDDTEIDEEESEEQEDNLM